MRLLCEIPNCDNLAKVGPKKALCIAHYRRQRGETKLPMDAPIQHKRKGHEICALPFCYRRQTKRDWCEYHYYQITRSRPVTPYQRRTNEPESWHECEIRPCKERTRSGTIICSKHRYLATKYGLDHETLIEIYGDGSCRVCGGTNRPSMDHDHSCCPVGNGRKCGKCVRGLLCHNCNIILGNAKDSPEILRSLIAYLEG